MMAVAALAVFLRNACTVNWHPLAIVMALLATVPFLQFAAGVLFFSGQAWVCTAYVLGLLLALLAGAQWEAATPGKAADGLFLAIGIASMVSVGIQLWQWLGIAADTAELQIWFAEYSPARPSANLGQPNQLATLFVWALLGCAWGSMRKQIRPFFAISAAIVLLFGIALSQSRVAGVALLLVTCSAWGWRRFLPRGMPWVATALFFYFVVCTLSLQAISDALELGVQIRSASLGGSSTQLRIKAYTLFLDAVAQKPLWGYGWNQLALAQLSVADRHPTLTAFFMHSHNLFLDFVLWCGIPIGGVFSVYIIAWWIRCIKRVANIEDAILIMFVTAVGLHAMVELPLHHAYLLLPTGLVMGMLNQRMHHRVIWASSRWIIVGLCVGASILLFIIIKDYLRVDEGLREYKLEQSHVGQLPPGKPPEVLLLNDMRAFIQYARLEVSPSDTEQDLVQMETIAVVFPTPINMFNYAKALAFRKGPEAAAAWIKKVQMVQPKEVNHDMRINWIAQSRTQPAMAAVKWPLME